MANQEHLDILAKGVDAWNAWRASHPEKNIDLIGANLATINVGPINFDGADLSQATLHNARMRGAKLNHADLRSAGLTYADIGDGELRHADLRSADLRDADLRRADLRYAELDRAIAVKTCFRDSDLSGARVRNAHLTQANFIGANLAHADLSRSKLGSADLRYAKLSGTNFNDATLYRANFGDAQCAFTSFGNVDLSSAENLDTVQHRGPSVVDVTTIYRSEGKIPESFLRGAGVPEDFILYFKSLPGVAIEFYSCFISYSTKDQAFADHLHADLQARGVRCWFAPHDIQGGRKIHEQIDEAIRVYDKLLLILSDASMGSEWVSTEISKARKRERVEGRRMLFPISLVPFDAVRDWECFDADAGKDAAREIREFFIPDFSNWKSHDDYSRAFERLMRDLKANTDKPAAQPAP